MAPENMETIARRNLDSTDVVVRGNPCTARLPDDVRRGNLNITRISDEGSWPLKFLVMNSFRIRFSSFNRTVVYGLLTDSSYQLYIVGKYETLLVSVCPRLRVVRQ
jgi:hypothetical protein